MTIRSILRLFVVLVLMLAVLVVSRDILDVRLGDLDYLLMRASRESSEAQASGLLGRYELIRRRLLSGEGALDQYELEARIAAITSEVRFDADPRVSHDATPPARFVVATLRTILGKEPIQTEAESAFLPRVEEAYFLERMRDYAAAERMYAELRAEPELPGSLRPTVELHRAFCLSMLGSHEEAGYEYTRIAEAYAGTETAFLARRLSYLLAEIRTTRELEPGGDHAAAGFDDGVDAYLRMDYRRAEERLEAFLSGNTGPGRNVGPGREAEGRYYLGRALEEQGRIDEAVEQYDRVGWLAPDSKWAKESGRRLVMISEFYRLSGTAGEVRSDLPPDREFRDRIRPYEPLVVRRDSRTGGRTAVDGSDGDSGTSFGALWLRSAPSGAEVRISDRTVGRTPLILDNLEAGAVEVELRAGRGRVRAVIEVPAGGRAVRDLTLSFPRVVRPSSHISGTTEPGPQPLPFRSGPRVRGADGGAGAGGPRQDDAGSPREQDAELRALDARIAELVSRRDALRRRASISESGLDRGRALSFGIGAMGAGVGGVLYVLSQLSYGNYEQADTADEAVRYREQTVARSRAAVAGAVVAGAGLLAGSVLGYLDDRSEGWTEELHDIESELERLRDRRDALSDAARYTPGPKY